MSTVSCVSPLLTFEPRLWTCSRQLANVSLGRALIHNPAPLNTFTHWPVPHIKVDRIVLDTVQLITSHPPGFAQTASLCLAAYVHATADASRGPCAGKDRGTVNDVFLYGLPASQRRLIRYFILSSSCWCVYRCFKTPPSDGQHCSLLAAASILW